MKTLRKQDHPQPAPEEYRTIELTQNQFAIVDIDDFHELIKVNWHAKWSRCTRSFYAVRHLPVVDGFREFVSMQRVIIGARMGDPIVDHANRNTLDNRRQNLRYATPSQNTMNRGLRIDSTSGFSGVHQRKDNGKFSAHICVEGRKIFLGSAYKCIEDAVAARHAAMESAFGDFAPRS